jgi:hypothetical protein
MNGPVTARALRGDTTTTSAGRNADNASLRSCGWLEEVLPNLLPHGTRNCGRTEAAADQKLNMP